MLRIEQSPFAVLSRNAITLQHIQVLLCYLSIANFKRLTVTVVRMAYEVWSLTRLRLFCEPEP